LAISSQPGLLARTVADLELALRMMDTRSRPGFGDPGALSIRMMRVALYTDNGVMQVAPALRRAVVEAGAALASRGAYVEEWKPPGVEEAWPKYLGILMADGSANARRICQGSKLAPTVRQVLLAGLTPRWFHRIVSAPILRTSGQKLLAGATEAMGYVSADEYWQLLSWQASFRERFLIGLDRGRFDVLICPPDVLPALRHGSGQYLSAALSYSAVYNLLSMPAGVVAVTRVRPDEESDRGLSWDLVVRKAVQCEAGSVGLPVGVQVAAKQHREDIVLCVMKAIEEHFRSLPDYPLHPPI